MNQEQLHSQYKGLSDEEVLRSREKNGANSLVFKNENAVLLALKSLVKEPMVLLLLIASAIYFVSGEISNGVFLASAIVLVAGISLYQDSRSRNALEKLKTLTQPHCKVIRNQTKTLITSEELVIGDVMIAEEGSSISADGIILQSNDFAVNESVLTGESMSVSKDAKSENKQVFRGTNVASGMALIEVTAIGNATQLGKIGISLESIAEEKTPLELQISSFVKKMVIIGAIVFLIVWSINYFHSWNLLDSLLKALTLAMSILPEEIPVAFTTFMALGAWRLMKLGIVVKQMKTVETLGSASVICTDKTGTITENRMSLAKLYVLKTNSICTPEKGKTNESADDLLKLAMFASEPHPFDPMEIALHAAYESLATKDERASYKMIHEYPLSGKPPMMTHVFKGNAGDVMIAAKGAPEALIAVSNLNSEDKTNILSAVIELAKEGYRVLGVGQSIAQGEPFPEEQQSLSFVFKGLVAFYDPPKANIREVLNAFYAAGIKVKIITGDNAETTGAIARETGFEGADRSISGDELMALSNEALEQRVHEAAIFTRMFPEAKLKIINALKAKQEIVAMTGDGVNDGPALKSAHIGIAMGKKGTEIAKQAASLIIADDDLAKMVDAIAMGRKIYTNLKKAIQYIISIHVPIVLTVFIPLALGWIFPNLFTPVHIIFLELIMGPTCSIIYENEPIEANTMKQVPRPFSSTFFNWKELTTSLVQGLAITAGTLFAYQYAVRNGYDEMYTRSMVFTTLIAANIFLTLVNRSFYYSVFTTLFYKNRLVPLIIGITLAITTLILYVHPLSDFFGFAHLTISQLLLSLSVGCISVVWFELVKWRTRYSAGKHS